ncbi:unnamed protein product [Mycena citricolor]|uniref:F-box domain-containing protein n=1 Tax=Mycena citricolor TaxID=2018698 RepID=A0AAD2H0X8_9AGAR|nr:unnamed protein product [Mycena citricolor]
MHILDLPAELLIAIIVHLPRHPEKDYTTVDESLRNLAGGHLTPLSLVCSTWRRVVQGTPSLWARITLHGPVWEISLRRGMHILRTSLSRADTHPLDIVVSSPPHRPALDLLAARAEQWRTLRIFCYARDLRYLGSLGRRFAALESVDVRVDGLRWDGGGPVSEMDLFEHSVKLRAISGSSAYILRLPSLRVERLLFIRLDEIDRMSVPRIPSTMARLPVGSTCVLSFANCSIFIDKSVSNPPPHATSLSHVRALHLLELDRGNSWHNIISNLTLPDLEHLCLSTQDGLRSTRLAVQWAASVFLSLASRSGFGPRLRTLCLQGVFLPERDLIACLEALPVLESLALADHLNGVTSDLTMSPVYAVTDRLLGELTMRAQTLVPCLRLLHCRTLLRFHAQSFLAFLVSRMIDGACFACILDQLGGPQDEVPVDLVEIEILCSTGKLAFTLSNRSPSVVAAFEVSHD